MWVLLIYVALIITGDIISYGIGAVISNAWGDGVSLPFFLAMYFGTLGVAWIIAVRIVERLKLVN